ncbi:MAG: hypothetical protein U5K33_09610 [Halofilum sp. (in: g-proteobacteria)]|nr:hypothetical protein [Halofilum sp. (in: g-proteobacteria)]
MEFFTFRYRNRESEYEDPRRDFLVKALTMGLFTAAGTLQPGRVGAMGERPRQLPPGRSVFRARGDVRINGLPASKETVIRPVDRCTSMSGSQRAAVQRNACSCCGEHRRELELSPLLPRGGGGGAGDEGFAATILGGLRLLTGRILTVFGERGPAEKLSMNTPIATIGIRGTGVYVESRNDRDYVCTCYGSTVLESVSDADSREEITTSHHDSPRYILDAGPEGRRILPAPVINHTDMELVLLEQLVGRKPPFWPLETGY